MLADHPAISKIGSWRQQPCVGAGAAPRHLMTSRSTRTGRPQNPFLANAPCSRQTNPPGTAAPTASRRRELHACKSGNPRPDAEVEPHDHWEPGAIWRIPEPPILFLLV